MIDTYVEHIKNIIFITILHMINVLQLPPTNSYPQLVCNKINCTVVSQTHSS